MKALSNEYDCAINTVIAQSSRLTALSGKSMHCATGPLIYEEANAVPGAGFGQQ
jgi:hypothetical protein